MNKPDSLKVLRGINAMIEHCHAGIDHEISRIQSAIKNNDNPAPHARKIRDFRIRAEVFSAGKSVVENALNSESAIQTEPIQTELLSVQASLEDARHTLKGMIGSDFELVPLSELISDLMVKETALQDLLDRVNATR